MKEIGVHKSKTTKFNEKKKEKRRAISKISPFLFVALFCCDTFIPKFKETQLMSTKPEALWKKESMHKRNSPCTTCLHSPPERVANCYEMIVDCNT